MEDISNYEKIREDARSLYGETRPVHSPALNDRVHFTAEGFNHIIFKGSRSERERPSQVMRFKLLPRAVRLIAHANTFQEFEETIKEFEVKARKKRVRKSKSVRYWGIIAIFEGRKIKVILRKIGDGQVHFWSIVPAWTTNKHRDAKFVSTMKGNPEED
ncbi:MAG TPA: hypothetical protein VJA87_00425 [Candidatus Paceibacterota bacterium]